MVDEIWECVTTFFFEFEFLLKQSYNYMEKKDYTENLDLVFSLVNVVINPFCRTK